MSLPAVIDPTSEVSVTSLLEHARTWIAQAVENSSPMEIAFAKAQIATAAEATKQLNLSKEIQLDAQEMVRRAEYALGKAIRKGQAEGTIAKRGDIGSAGQPGVHGFATGLHRGEHLARPQDASGERNKQTLSDFYVMADAGEEHFDAALAEAKAEGNLSRRNVVGKAKARTRTRDQRADLIATLANQGYSSRQMPAKVGVSEQSVRQIARDYDIDIPADKYVANTRRINSTQVVENTATALEGLVSGIELIDYDDVDPATASQWADSLKDSVSKLRSFATQIDRKATQ